MREIKIRVPKETIDQVIDLAMQSGVDDAVSHEIFLHKKKESLVEINVKTSTPIAKIFIGRLLNASFFDRRRISFSTHDLRSLVNSNEMRDLTVPVPTPLIDIFEDLWQQSQITVAFLGKVAGGALLLTYAMMKNDPILMVGALLFTPFTPLLMSISFGVCSNDKHLVRQGMRAFSVGTIATILCASLVALFHREPMDYRNFGSLVSNVWISFAAGIIAGLAEADDIGRRQLIALAATFPYVKFPIWFGTCLVQGFPDERTTNERVLIFALNVAIIIATTTAAYKFLGVPRRLSAHFVSRSSPPT